MGGLGLGLGLGAGWEQGIAEEEEAGKKGRMGSSSK